MVSGSNEVDINATSVDVHRIYSSLKGIIFSAWDADEEREVTSADVSPVRLLLWRANKDSEVDLKKLQSLDDDDDKSNLGVLFNF